MRWIGLVVLVVVGCATPYQSLGMRGGYSEIQLNQRAYEVNFAGNGYSSPGYVRTMATRRAAELTLAAGLTHFLVVDDAADVSFATMPVSCVNGTCSGGQLVSKPGSRIRVVMLTPQQAAQAAMAIDARMYLSQFAEPALPADDKNTPATARLVPPPAARVPAPATPARAPTSAPATPAQAPTAPPEPAPEAVIDI
jgi:hypothetical protein